MEIMPFFAGAIATFGDQSDFFDHLLKICNGLPDRFHRWYGDQWAIASAVKAGNIQYGLLEPEKHLFIAKQALSVQQVISLKANSVQMVTFKGPQSKKYLFTSLESLKYSKA